MSSARALLARLAARGIVLSLNDGRLRYSAPAGALTDDDRAAIARHRPMLLELLTGTEIPAPDPHPERSVRVRNRHGAWRTPAEHEAIHAFDAHHWACLQCRRAGIGYGDRCPDGDRLHAAVRIAMRNAR